MEYVIPPAPITSLPIQSEEQSFPVRRIYCVGRNYAEHAREMGHDPDREPPFFFTKPPSAIVPSGVSIPFPSKTKDLHHEIELVVAIQEGGVQIPIDQALNHVFGYGVGLDMTRRDIQAQAKKMGRPWDLAKGFDQSAPCSALQPASKIGHPTSGSIWLKVNGELHQEGDLAQQIWKVPEVIAYLSEYVALQAGDLIMTGTPKGVQAVSPGDRLEGYVEGVGTLEVQYEVA